MHACKRVYQFVCLHVAVDLNVSQRYNTSLYKVIARDMYKYNTVAKNGSPRTKNYLLIQVNLIDTMAYPRKES